MPTQTCGTSVAAAVHEESLPHGIPVPSTFLHSLIIAFCFMSSSQEPFETLPPEFKEDITDEMKRDLRGFMRAKERRQWEIVQMLFIYMLETLIPQSKDTEAVGAKDYP